MYRGNNNSKRDNYTDRREGFKLTRCQSEKIQVDKTDQDKAVFQANKS